MKESGQIAPQAKTSKHKWLGRIGTFLMMGGWLLILVLVLAVIILISIAFCLPIFSAYTFAQGTTTVQDCTNSNICSAPPPAFRLMTNFIKEMTIAIKTVGTRDPYVGQYVSPSWFQGNEFVPPKEGVISKFMRNIRQKLQSALAVTAISTDLKNRGGMKDFA